MIANAGFAIKTQFAAMPAVVIQSTPIFPKGRTMKKILFALLLGTLATAASAELMYYGDDSPRIELDRSRIGIDRSDRAYERRGRYDDDYRYDRRYRDYDDYRRDNRRYRDYGYTFDSDNGFNIRYGWGNDRTRIDMRYGNGYRRYRDDYDDGYRRRYRRYRGGW